MGLVSGTAIQNSAIISKFTKSKVHVPNSQGRHSCEMVGLWRGAAML